MGLKAQKDTHGRIVGYEFVPTNKMLRLVIEYNKESNRGLSNEEILKKCGITEAEHQSWWRDHVIVPMNADGTPGQPRNFFEEWFDNALEIKSGEERQMLMQVGMQKALEGNFNFWDKLARTFGVINPEAVHEKPMTIPFNLKDDLTPEQIADARQKLLAAHRSMGNSGSPGLVRLASKRQKSPNG